MELYLSPGNNAGRLRGLYLKEVTFFRKYLLWKIIPLFIVLVGVSCLGYLGYHFNTQYPNNDTEQMISEANQKIKNVLPLLRRFKGYLWIGIFLNNLIASAWSTITGIIPFLFLPVLTILGQASILGLLIGEVAHGSGFGLSGVLLSIASHGIFEISAFLYSASLGMFICLQLSKKIIPKYRPLSLPFRDVMRQLASSYVLVIIPLLLIAGILEVAVTPKIITLLEKDPMVFFKRGNYHYSKKNYNEAIANYSKAIQRDPKLAKAHYQLGRAYSATEQYDKAITSLSKVIEIDPGNARTYISRSMSYVTMHKYDLAIADSKKAIELNPSKPEGYNNLAWIYATAEESHFRDGKQAVALALKACDLSKWKDNVAIDTLAAAYARVGDFDNAIKWEEKVRETSEGSFKKRIEKRLTAYRNKKPWQEE
jgi:uncharacterized membrane protein SpoIIM required for sporulation/Tfp pilus assembly protein PilF